MDDPGGDPDDDADDDYMAADDSDSSGSKSEDAVFSSSSSSSSAEKAVPALPDADDIPDVVIGAHLMNGNHRYIYRATCPDTHPIGRVLCWTDTDMFIPRLQVMLFCSSLPL